MLDRSGWNTKLNKGKFINMGGFPYETELSTLAMTLGNSVTYC